MLPVLCTIPGSDKWRSCEKLNLGWSSDEKYIVIDETGRKLLLRTAKEDQYEVKYTEFELLRKIEKLSVNASRPVDFGRFEGGVYTLYTWIGGESMEEALPQLSPKEQYALGYEAGQLLRRIHTIPAPTGVPDWEERMNRKMDRKIRMARECEIEIPAGSR